MKKFLLLLMVCFMPLGYSFTDTLDIATPAGSDSPTQGDDRIRELKRAYNERLAVDHTWPASGSTYDGATVGYHKAIRLPEQSPSPSTPASYGAVYTKDSGTQPELYYREESDGDEVQLTSNGAINVNQGVMGQYRNLVVSRNTSAQITITADSLILENSGGTPLKINTVSEVIDVTVSGAGGLVSALSEASGTWYYGWIARKSSDGTVNGFLSTSADKATVLGQLDSGYDQLALVTAVRNDGSSNFIDFNQVGSRYSYATWQTLASGAPGSSWTSIDTTAFVPSSLSTYAYGSSYTSGNDLMMANDNTVSTTTSADATNRYQFDFNTNGPNNSRWEFDIKTANTLYWLSTTSGNKLYIHGFHITKVG